ncbi:uncharacterized protein CPUR_06327 [Claviceps purpurea 20.1]|uniref:BTB domain-containing protein n=1 Tax=Claviceps purpurea (strain 20.1) TaxID=1111077 RepID=M1VX62_CLAP2|nr:hypothetical protein E4U46_005632 [Claviceps purpurea]CCE32467.1 uncharacterized protein CPUR_06327 [Claviceps purpurea 20.1]
MAASLSEGIFTSRPCVLVVGEDKREFLLHSDLVKRESKALGEIIDASFAEGRKGYVVLRDDDVETISAFAQFIYTGDYQLSFDMSAPEVGNESHDKDNPEDNFRPWTRPGNGFWHCFTKSKKYRDQAYLYDTSFDPYEISYSGPEDDDPDDHDMCFNSDHMEKDYSELFISHAKIFVFAHSHDMEALMGLSIRKLHGALCWFALSRERIGDILALARYCYKSSGAEKLRRMVASYSAAILHACVSRDVTEFVLELLTDKSEFAFDSVWFMSRRMIGSTYWWSTL